MKIKQKNEGITLIALIITIILMLILASVSISMIVNDEIFDYAGQAVEETEKAKNDEQELVNTAINDYIKPNMPKKHKWTQTGNTFTCSHCNATYEMGQEVDYTADETSRAVTVTAQESGLDEYKQEEGSYPTEDYINSTTGVQTIGRQANKEMTWIVLGIADTNNDNVYETLLITTQEETEESMLYLYGAAGYNNGVDIINRICKNLYSNAKYGEARGMTVEDVNNALGYEPKGGYYRDKKGVYQYTDGFETKIGDIEGARTGLKGCENTPDATKDIFDDYYNEGYIYYIRSDYSDDGEDYYYLVDDDENNLGTVNTVWAETMGMHWLANKWIWTDLVTPNVSFGLFSSTYADVLGRGLYFARGMRNGFDFAVRPVVELTSELPQGK